MGHPEKVDLTATLHHCDQCEFRVHGEVRLRRHMKTFHPVRSFPCPDCPLIAKTAQGLRRHQKRIHEGIEAPHRYVCDVCCFVCGDKQALKVHKAAKHQIDVERFYCDQCDFSSLYKNSIRQHCNWVHAEVKPVVPKTTHFCEYCEYSSKSKQCLQMHIDKTHLGITFQCEVCSYTCSSEKRLEIHRKGKHGGGWACQQCSYRATQQSSLKAHVLARHENVKFYCDQ